MNTIEKARRLNPTIFAVVNAWFGVERKGE